jgi:acyl-homoserine lactone acylase PvdQ
LKPEALRPVGRTTLEQTPRDGVRILRDSWGVAHIYGRASADTEWAAGWVTAEDRGLVLQLIRGPGRVAAIDGPAYDQSREFVPSRAASSRIELRWTNRPSFQQVISFSGHRSR